MKLVALRLLSVYGLVLVLLFSIKIKDTFVKSKYN